MEKWRVMIQDPISGQVRTEEICEGDNDEAWAVARRLSRRYTGEQVVEGYSDTGDYVRTSDGRYLVQLCDDTATGWSLYDDDQSWEGGVGCGAESWQVVSAHDVPGPVRRRLEWLFM